MNQPTAAKMNLKQWFGSLEPLLDKSGVREIRSILNDHDAVSELALGQMWARKLGLPTEAVRGRGRTCRRALTSPE